MNAVPDRLRALLSELDASKPRVVVVKERDGGAMWSMRVRDGTEWRAEWHAEPSRLMLNAALGRPVAGNEQLLYEAALSYNALMRETGCITLAMRETSRELLLQRELLVDALSLETLRAALADFAASLRMWSVFVANQASAVAGAARAPSESFQSLA